ncbi:G-type lectin S-receptor-like serine/threonine-protein kinase SD2-5 [Eucalyptus grandis]|uniref:G-type lectin S-receptor-like serine/threonine-protein kinase SD2-5 n=1 Tax=Eucalyptus grandis TaxID=71139 RepID=UPI00192E7BD8|nr:G-type lectin S-receptor-like serine/threonine-protein kinase SD2-5 [Eucalyptus grandis]
MVLLCSLPSFFLSFSFVLLSPSSNFIPSSNVIPQARDYDHPTATLSTQWTINATANHSTQYRDGSVVQEILFRGKGATAYYSCGFYCKGNCTSYLFAVLIFPAVLFERGPGEGPRVVWSANRNNPIKIGATLELTPEGDLVLKDADGTVAWSTNTSAKSVVGLNLTDLGNLVLFDKDNATVWQSFDHPTDSLVLGQKLRHGQRLTQSNSETNWTIDDMITFSVNSDGLSAQVETNPPQIYFNYKLDFGNTSIKISYVEFVNGSLSWFSNSTSSGTFFSIPSAPTTQHMTLGSDGHLKVYKYGRVEVADLFELFVGDCAYPTVCGQYGICSNGQCSCPASSGGTSYFQPVDARQPQLGCFENGPLSCGASQQQSLLEQENIAYFSLTPNLEHIDVSSCKEACAKNCSCKAAIFRYESNRTNGSCYLPTQVFSLMNIDLATSPYNSTAFLKVQNLTNEAPYTPVDNPMSNEAPYTPVDNPMSNRLPVILGSSLGALFAMMILIVAIVLFVQKRDDNQAEEDYLDNVPGMPTRFAYDDLKTITNGFDRKLGEGGFGSVFEGTLRDGTKVAVKRLDGFGQVKKSFLAEVETIGSIHHVNLVRLMGFCAEKSHRLLIYEYMSNGSLDRWIFHKSNECVLDWQQRKKIILDIAKGLNYLHEDCRQKIVHLDIKPQNILLDENFNAKVADFGLSKLIDKDQSQIVTTMRGTPGYLAPEWLSAAITEKVDVYSFGVVILEILCGRKIFDRSLDEEDMYLLSLFKRKAEEERLLDIVDKSSDDMQLNGSNAMNMMRIAAWCLQGDYIKRPPMSMVIKALQGIVKVQEDLDYDFSAQPSSGGVVRFDLMDVEFNATATLLPSILSGPR